MYVAADEAVLLSDQLADLNSISDFNNRSGWGTRMHGSRNYNSFRFREFCQRNVLSKFFIFSRMNTSVVAGKTAVPDLFNKIIDHFEVGFCIITQLDRLL